MIQEIFGELDYDEEWEYYVYCWCNYFLASEFQKKPILELMLPLPLSDKAREAKLVVATWPVSYIQEVLDRAIVR